MQWWQNAFPSKSQSHEDSVIVGDEMHRFSLRSGLFSSRRSRRLNRPRKVRQVAKNDVHEFELCKWRSLGHLQNSNSKSTPAPPQPLPLPELRLLLQQDPRLTSAGVPLPSPGLVQNQREITETVNSETQDAVNGLKSKLGGHDAQTNAEYAETRSCPKSMLPQKPKARYSEFSNYSIPSTAPSSPYTSPPRGEFWVTTRYMIPPGASSQMPPDENPGQGSSYRPWESSPPQSSHPHTSPPRPVSPLTTGWESNIHANVHPLPRPPGAPMSSQTTPVSPVGAKPDFPGPLVTSQSTPNLPLTVKAELLAASIPAQPSPISPSGSKREVLPVKSQWQKGKLIGRGSFGSVYVASNRETGALCAMKEVEILPDDSKSAECLRQLQQEIKVLSQLKHQNIVQYYGSEIIGDKFYIYLEYVHPGSINKFIRDHCGAITESVVRNFTRHILCGLAYLHSTKTIHRDIKGANLLVDANGVVKLADFGMAKHLTGQKGNLSLKGSPYWMAPELLQSSMQIDANSDAALAIDIWSLGCTIIEMMSGKPPWSEYEGPAALFKVLKQTPPIPETLSDDGKDFLQCCFRRNPADRPSASKLLDHPFVSQSHQPDSCVQPLKETRFMDNAHLARNLRRHKSEPLPEPFDTQIRKTKLSYNFALVCFSPVRLDKEAVVKHSI